MDFTIDISRSAPMYIIISLQSNCPKNLEITLSSYLWVQLGGKLHGRFTKS